MKNEGKGDGAGEGEGKGEGEGRRQSSPPHSSTLRSARTSGNALVVYEMSRQVLPTAPSPTITHFTFCIIDIVRGDVADTRGLPTGHAGDSRRTLRLGAWFRRSLGGTSPALWRPGVHPNQSVPLTRLLPRPRSPHVLTCRGGW